MQTIAIVNQKGGVGKSTTAVNLGAGLVRQGKRVLLIDADSQANLTEMLGWQQQMCIRDRPSTSRIPPLL